MLPDKKGDKHIFVNVAYTDWIKGIRCEFYGGQCILL